MARKGPVKKPPIPQDTKYNSSTITKFINAIMLDGKKSIAAARKGLIFFILSLSLYLVFASLNSVHYLLLKLVL